MKRKNTEADLLKLYMAEAIILLLENNKFSDITIKEITRKAGVNRSSYYRDFDSKEEIIVFFYTYILNRCIPIKPLPKIEEHLLNIFNQFLNYKIELLSLHKNNLSYLLLEVLNNYFIKRDYSEKNIGLNKEFELCYHTGGIFNTLLLWFDLEMKPEPNLLVEKSMQFLPKDFKPFMFSIVEQ